MEIIPKLELLLYEDCISHELYNVPSTYEGLIVVCQYLFDVECPLDFLYKKKEVNVKIKNDFDYQIFKEHLVGEGIASGILYLERRIFLGRPRSLTNPETSDELME